MPICFDVVPVNSIICIFVLDNSITVICSGSSWYIRNQLRAAVLISNVVWSEVTEKILIYMFN